MIFRLDFLGIADTLSDLFSGVNFLLSLFALFLNLFYWYSYNSTHVGELDAPTPLKVS